MVLRRVYLQNFIFYSLILVLASWLSVIENNFSVLAFWFIPMLTYIVLTTQLNHTRNDSILAKIIHHILFLVKFIMIYLTAGLMQSYPLWIVVLIFASIAIVISMTEYFLLRGKNQVIRYIDLFRLNEQEILHDKDEALKKAKYRNETGLSFITLGFLIGSIHALEVPEFEVVSIVMTVLITSFAIFLYRKLQISNRKTYIRILDHNLMEEKKLKKIYLLAQVLLHLSLLLTIAIKILEGPDSISFLLIIPILINYPLIYLNRKLAKGLLSSEEKEILNID
jgi:hypothetical protein